MKRRFLATILFEVAIILFSFDPACAEGPMKITTGAYIMNLHSLEIKDNTFKVTLWLWFWHDSKDFSPAETLDVTNAVDFKFSHAGTYEGNSEHPLWSGMKVIATIKKGYDLAMFPFDRQVLDINFEDSSDISLVKFEPDKKNSRFDPDIVINGWKPTGFEVISGEKVYNTTFGDPSLSGKSTYSRFTVRMILQRMGLKIFISIISVAIIAYLLSFLSVVVPPREISPKFTLAMCSVAGVVATKYSIDTRVPSATDLTLVDKVLIIVFLLILLNVFINVIITILVFNDKKAQAFKVNRIFSYIAPLLFIITLAAFFIFSGIVF
ncbi:MAG: hypothetical protein AB1546_06125 [bacterium]